MTLVLSFDDRRAACAQILTQSHGSCQDLSMQVTEHWATWGTFVVVKFQAALRCVVLVMQGFSCTALVSILL